MDQALFTIRPANYSHATEALKTVDCYLTPTATQGIHAVSCSAQYAHIADSMRERAREALESHSVLVFED